MAQQDWQKYLNFRCTGCGNCCRRTTVMVTDEDIHRIQRGVGLPADDFIHFVDQKDVNLPKRGPWWVHFGPKRAVMALRHRAGGACIFLDNEQRCTIYEHRPVTCREHPLDLDFSDNGAIELITLSDIVDCPHDWDGNLTRTELRRVAKWNERQSDRYLDEVERWNRRRTIRKTRPAFLRYLGFDT